MCGYTMLQCAATPCWIGLDFHSHYKHVVNALVTTGYVNMLQCEATPCWNGLDLHWQRKHVVDALVTTGLLPVDGERCCLDLSVQALIR